SAGGGARPDLRPPVGDHGTALGERLGEAGAKRSTALLAMPPVERRDGTGVVFSAAPRRLARPSGFGRTRRSSSSGAVGLDQPQFGGRPQKLSKRFAPSLPFVHVWEVFRPAQVSGGGTWKHRHSRAHRRPRLRA